ncbi:MAG: PDZ domain-containing protein [Armatimonadetes bacterium]|nr:PDZ domain-containing protein [Armatimonadota bacterium]
MAWRLVVSAAFSLCFICGFSIAQQDPSVNEIVAKAAKVNRFWLTLPYEKGLSYTYQFVVYNEKPNEPRYVAQVYFKAPDKARLEEKVKPKLGGRTEELYTVIYNSGEYGWWTSDKKKVGRGKYFGLNAPEPTIAFKMAFQFFPPSRYFFADFERFSVHLVGKEKVNGHEVWVVETKGKFRGHLGRGVGMHITFGGSTFGGDTLRLYVDAKTYALLKEETIYEDAVGESLEYGNYRKLGDYLVPMTILWTHHSGDKSRPSWIDRLDMQIVGGRVWMVRQVFSVTRGKVDCEVKDVQLKPLSDKLFELPKPSPREEKAKFESSAKEVKRTEEQPEFLTLSGKHFVIHYPKELEAYAKAFLQIGDAAREAYQELYGLPLPDKITMHVRLVQDQPKRARLWTNGKDSLFLEVGSEEPLKSPEKGGAHNVYGICHELGHIVIYHRLRHLGEVGELPEGVPEGFAHYFGSAITSYLFEKLGAQVYPDPHNYHETSGMARLLRQFERAERKERQSWLGIGMSDAQPQGVTIVEVFPNSPAQQAGLKAQDTIIEFQGTPVKDRTHLANLIQSTKPGTEVVLKILRQGKEMTLTAKIGEREVGGWDANLKAAKLLYDIEQRYGRKALGQALNKALEGKPKGSEVMPKFAEALAEVTGDPASKALFPQALLKPSKPSWRFEITSIADPQLYRGLKVEVEDKTVKLSYDDGTKDGQMSLVESGHGIFFQAPEGKWQIIAVEFYGARYGALKPPDKQFSVFLCDENFEVIREFKAPYSLFPKPNEWQWVRIEIEPTYVPKFFWVVLVFNSTAREGIYVGYDSHKEQITHSASALPEFHITDGPGQADWMIRCYLKPADELTAQKIFELVNLLKAEVSGR